MLASDIIVSDLSPLKPSDAGEDALQIMEDYLVRHLPVVHRREVLGVISEVEILENDTLMPIESYHLPLRPVYVKEDDHLFEVLEMVALTNLTCIPVVDHKLKYKGAITIERLVHSFANAFAFNENGAILVLEMNKNDYSMTEISRIVESENGMILSSFVSQLPDDDKIYVTLKINLNEVSFLRATFERYGYHIKATFTETAYIETLKDRYESLMNFLNI